jgi:hypothetical protein
VVRKPLESSWERFLVECGVDPANSAVVSAVKITARRHLEKCGRPVSELPGSTGYDMAALPADIHAELVGLVRRALTAFREAR